jgi:hypothetical protein
VEHGAFEVDLVPAKIAHLGRAQTMRERQQDHGGVAVTVPVAVGGLDQLRDLVAGQVLSGPQHAARVAFTKIRKHWELFDAAAIGPGDSYIALWSLLIEMRNSLQGAKVQESKERTITNDSTPTCSSPAVRFGRAARQLEGPRSRTPGPETFTTGTGYKTAYHGFAKATHSVESAGTAARIST